MRDDPDDPEKHARWRCLGACHDGGGPAGLVMRIFGFERARQAWDWIRGNADAPEPEQRLAVEFIEPAPLTPRSFRLPPGVILRPLEEWPAPARWYLDSRGVTEEQVDRWGIGYSIDGKLSSRIVLPWRDGRGRLLGYTARSFLPSAVKRYLEPREDEGADRSAVYGEEHWPVPGARGRVYVTEGGIDALAVERAVQEPVAALCGSVLLPGHVARLSTFTEVVIASDPDKAGKGLLAAARAALRRWVSVKDAQFPTGYDCARYASQWGDAALGKLLLTSVLS